MDIEFKQYKVTVNKPLTRKHLLSKYNMMCKLNCDFCYMTGQPLWLTENDTNYHLLKLEPLDQIEARWKSMIHQFIEIYEQFKQTEEDQIL